MFNDSSNREFGEFREFGTNAGGRHGRDRAGLRATARASAHRARGCDSHLYRPLPRYLCHHRSSSAASSAASFGLTFLSSVDLFLGGAFLGAVSRPVRRRREEIGHQWQLLEMQLIDEAASLDQLAG